MRQKTFRIKKLLSLLLTLVIACSLMPAVVFAKTEEFAVELNEAQKNYVFSIQWENTDKKPDVVLTSPSGKAYSLDNMPEADSGDGEMMFYFPSAEKGTWKVKITGDGLGKVTLDSGVMPGRMNISSFQVKITGEKGEASWQITESEENLILEIWVAEDPVNYGGEKLSSVSGKASGNCEFSLAGLDSGEYYLYLKAIGSKGIYACQYADGVVSWRHRDALPKLSGIKARMLDDDLWLSWEETEDANSYRVLVFDPATGEVLIDERIEEESNWYGEIPQNIDTVEAAVAACRRNVTGNYERYTVKRTSFDGVSVTFPEQDNLNTKTITVQVAFTGDYTVSAALNGEMVCEDSKESGEYRVDMEEGDNRVAFYITDSSGNVRSYGKDLHIDVTAPQLSVLRDLNGQSTSGDHVYLEGHTEGGAILTLNGQKVETQSGYFSIRCSLSFGDNTLELIATDAAGNQSRYTAVVSRPWFGMSAILWMICIVAAVALLVLYLILFIRGRRKRKS